MNPLPAALLEQHVPTPQVSLMQGDIQVSTDPKLLMTVLGSCVAVCLWDKSRGIGGMNHFVLPRDPRGENNPRYGDVAIDELESSLLWLGCKITDLQAKVFGGAAVLAFAGTESVGTSNVRLALSRLQDHRIRVTAQRTGGTLGQQIKFNTRTGEVFFRHLSAGTYRALAVAGPRG